MGMTIAPWRLVAGTAQKVAVGAASTSSSAFQTQTRAVLLSTTTDCHIRVSSNGAAAVATDLLVKAIWPPIVLGVAGGEILSVIEDAAVGSLYLQELTH